MSHPNHFTTHHNLMPSEPTSMFVFFFSIPSIILIQFFFVSRFIFFPFRSKSGGDNRKSRIQVSVWIWQWKFCRSSYVSTILSGELFFFSCCYVCWCQRHTKCSFVPIFGLYGFFYLCFVGFPPILRVKGETHRRTQNSFWFMVRIRIAFFTFFELLVWFGR